VEGDVVRLGPPWSDTADRVRSYASWFYHDDSTAEAHPRSRLHRVRFRWTRRLIWRDFRIRKKRDNDLPESIRSDEWRMKASTQTMKPTAPGRNEFSAFATTPCRALCL